MRKGEKLKLYIDTHDRDKIIVGIDDVKFERDAREKSSQMLLPFIDEVLKKTGKKTSDIKEIEVNTGPGSFTGLRVGVAVANTLGFVLKVSVNGKENGETEINY